jgi:anthranilate synthase component 1
LKRAAINDSDNLSEILWNYMQRFEVESQDEKAAKFAQGLYGYFTFDVVPLIEKIDFKSSAEKKICTHRLFH